MSVGELSSSSNSSDSSSSGSITNVSDYLNESKTNLIVNYLPQSMVSEEFRALFQSVGKLENCKLIKDKKTNQNLGYGFVNYVNIDDAEKAIQTMNGLKIENKIIKVSYARPSSETIKGANLYVSGLPKSWKTFELNNHFASCGKIITSRILINPVTNKSKGVAFVRYDLKSEAENAINKLNGVIPHECFDPLVVKFANFPAVLNIAKYSSSSPMVSNANNQQQFYQPTSPHIIQKLSPTLIQYGINLPASNAPSCLMTSPVMAAQTWCLFVSNLPIDVEENILWRLFGPFGAVLDVKLARDQTNQQRKIFGFVKMSSYDEAISAINSLNGIYFGNRILHVSFNSN